MKRICTKIGFTLAVLASLYTMAATPGCEETLGRLCDGHGDAYAAGRLIGGVFAGLLMAAVFTSIGFVADMAISVIRRTTRS